MPWKLDILFHYLCQMHEYESIRFSRRIMSKRHFYKEYYDRFSTRNIPKSTASRWKAKQKNAKFTSKQIVEKIPVASQSSTDLSSEETFEQNEPQSVIREDVADDNCNNMVTSDIRFNIPMKSIRTANKTKLNYKSSKREAKLTTTACKCTNVNVGEILLMFLQIMIKHSLTLSALMDIFKIINTIFNSKLLSETKYMLNKIMNVNCDSIFYHILCFQCKKYLGKYSSFETAFSCTCGYKLRSSKIGSFFIEIDVTNQLQNLFLDHNLVDSLQERFNRKKTNIDGLEDIYDGKLYQEYSRRDDLLGNPWNFSYTFNTDGCQTSFYSKVTVWPIYFMLHQLPDRLRKKHMVLAGLWVSKTEPDMAVFLDPLVDQANKLSFTGFKWFNNGTEIISKLFPLGCCIDSPARCAMLNMKKFNGYHGCTYCDHPTELVNNRCKYPMQQRIPLSRTDQSIKECMVEAHEKGSGDIVGVWGPSALMSMKHFDLVKGMVLDFMHSCLLGVTELYTSNLLQNSKEKYYIGSPLQVRIIDRRLLSMRPPSCIGKVPRSIKERHMWKASEWLLWLIFYCLPCLKGILQVQYYDNLALFVAAMTIFIEDSITPEMLENGRILLIKFVCGFQDLFGKQYMHYNIHLLLHLAETVENWGPLWSQSTFPFENQNQVIMKMKKCNYRIAQQIINRKLLTLQAPLLSNEEFISNGIADFCESLFSNRLKKAVKIGNCLLLGSGKKSTFNEKEIECLIKNNLDVSKITECKRYKRMIFNACRYTTYHYSKNKKNNDSVCVTKNCKYGIISQICKIKNDTNYYVIIFMYIITVDQEFIVSTADVMLNNIKSCNSNIHNDLHVIFPNMSTNKYLLCQLINIL